MSQDILLHVLIVELHFALCSLEILLIELYIFASKGVQRCSCKPDDEYLLSSDITRDLSFEAEPALEFKSYKRRFYILLLFSVIAFSQYCAWNTYGPIATTTKMVFGWTNTQIAFLASMDPITYLCTMQFFSWMMDEKGILTLYFSLAFFFSVHRDYVKGRDRRARDSRIAHVLLQYYRTLSTKPIRRSGETFTFAQHLSFSLFQGYRIRMKRSRRNYQRRQFYVLPSFQYNSQFVVKLKAGVFCFLSAGKIRELCPACHRNGTRKLLVQGIIVNLCKKYSLLAES